MECTVKPQRMHSSDSDDNREQRAWNDSNSRVADILDDLVRPEGIR